MGLVVFAVGVGLAVAGQGSGWVALFDGKTLTGWSVHSGFAKYHVSDGVLVGTAVQGNTY